MNLTFPSPEFDDAVAAVCHGSATEEEMRELNGLLRKDPQARDEYLMRVELHSRLASDPDVFSEAPAGVTPTSRAGMEACPPGQNILLEGNPGRGKWSWTGGLALAASLALLAAGVWHWGLAPAQNREGTPSAAIAVLTRAVDARWNADTPAPRIGGALAPGRLHLDAGMAQVVFYSGARVVLEGPVELRLISPTEAVCSTGRILAEVPPPARGFRLRTPQINVVDLGTTFGLEATDSRTEVHVFKGEVELSAGKGAKQSLVEGRAEVVEVSTAPRFLTANPEEFSAMFELQRRSQASETVRYDQWRVASARLNQDPALVVHLDLEDLSDSDWTLANAAQRNRTVPEAAIVGCQFAAGRWPEKRALEFQSVNDRVRLAVPGQFTSLTLAAWVRVNGLDRQLNSLFMCDGFEPGAVHWLIRNDGVLSLTVKGPGSRNSQIMASPPVLTLDNFGMWTHLAAVVDGKTRRVAHYVNGNPISRHDLRLPPPYRLGPSELGNWDARGAPNPVGFSVRNLSATLDEFELFSRALTDAEIRQLYNEGKPQPDP